MKRKLRFLLSAVCLFFILSANANNSPTTLTVGFRADNSNGCTNLLVAFHDESVSSGDPIIHWTWNFGDGNTSTEQHPVHRYTAGGTYDVKLVVETQAGLVDSLTKAGIVNVLQGPLAPFGKDTAICEGSSFLLNAMNPGSSYTWSTGDVTSSILVTEEDEYSVVIDLDGCLLYDTIKINIRPDVFPNFGYQQTGLCAPMPVQFTDSSTTCNGTAITAWKWEFGDGEISTLQNPTHTFNTQDTFGVKLTVWDENGTFITRTKKVIIGASALAPSLGIDTTICAGSSLILDAGITAASYQWSTGETTKTIAVSISGNYWVKVSNGGCEGTDTISVAANPALTVEFAYNQVENCIPATVEFTDQSASCQGSLTQWNWDFGDGNTSSEQNPKHIYSLAGSYFVTLTTRNNNGDELTSVQEIIVFGNANPTAGLPADSSVCEGELMQLTVAENGATYLWSTGETTQSIVVEDPGTYHVTIEKDGCSATDSVKVTFRPQLLPVFNYSRVADCDNLKIQFSDSSLTCGVTIVKWQWDLGDGTNSLAQHPLHIYNNPGTYTVKLKVTDDVGYSLTRTKTVTVASLKPVVNLGKDTAICYNSDFNLSAGNTGAEYLWSTGETTQSILVNDEDHYWVDVTENGCTGTDTVKIGVKFPVIPDFNFEVTSKCLPVAVNFTDKSALTCNEEVLSWRWDFGDGETTPNEQNPIHNFLSADSFTVRLTITTKNGVVITKSRRVVIENTAVSLELGPNVNICRGNAVELNAQLNGATYSWTPAAGLSSTTVANPVASPLQTTQYFLQATKCMLTVEDSITVVVDSIAKPEIRQVGNTLEAPAASAYKWFHNGKVLAGKTTKILSANSFGNYSVEVTNNAGCKNMSNETFFVPEGESDKELGSIRLKLSPNPSHGLLKVLLSKAPEKAVTVIIYDGFGNKVHIGSLTGNVNTLNLQKLSKGVYFLQCLSGKEKVTLSFSIQ